MFTYEAVKDKPALLLAMTSLNRNEFEQLVVYFRVEWESYGEQNVPPTSERQRQPGGGCKPVLRTDEDRLVHFALL